MKITLSVVALILSSTFASAGVLDGFKSGLKDFVNNFPAHQETCKLEFKTPIKNADGDILYYNDPTCLGSNGGNGPVSNGSPTPSTPPTKPADPVDPPKDCDSNGGDSGGKGSHGYGHGKGNGKY